MELGFRSNEAAVNTPFLDEALMISGDLNIVDVQMVVQYRISNLNNFLFKVDDPGEPVPRHSGGTPRRAHPQGRRGGCPASGGGAALHRRRAGEGP